MEKSLKQSIQSIIDWRKKQKDDPSYIRDEKKLLEIRNLSVSYGPIDALKNVNIDIHKGSVVSILGANGAGKTTLLKKISGLIDAKAGYVYFDGENITGLAPEKITQKGIVQSPEGRQVFADLSVKENLMIGAFTLQKQTVHPDDIYEDAKTKRVKTLLDQATDKDAPITLTKEESLKNNLARVYELFPVLKERENQVAVTLSGGEQQMLAIARAMMASPKLLVLDEPSLGLAPLIVKSIFAIITELNKMGTTVLLIEQNALQALKIADYAYVLQVGQVVKEGEAAKLLKDEALIEAYLGK